MSAARDLREPGLAPEPPKLSRLATFAEVAAQIGRDIEWTRRHLHALNVEAHNMLLVPLGKARNGRAYMVNLDALMAYRPQMFAATRSVVQKLEELEERVAAVECRG
jgi:hypothetical protein